MVWTGLVHRPTCRPFKPLEMLYRQEARPSSLTCRRRAGSFEAQLLSKALFRRDTGEPGSVDTIRRMELGCPATETLESGSCCFFFLSFFLVGGARVLAGVNPPQSPSGSASGQRRKSARRVCGHIELVLVDEQSSMPGRPHQKVCLRRGKNHFGGPAQTHSQTGPFNMGRNWETGGVFGEKAETVL